MRTSNAAVALAALICCAVAPAHEARFAAFGEIPADRRDREDETLGAIGSGAAFDPAGGEFLFISDRGPGDGKMDYRPRFDSVRVSESQGRLSFQISSTTLLRDADGKAMTGLIPDVRDADFPRMRDGRRCIDPEAIAIAPDGSLFVSDEYGPFLYHFSRAGRMLRCIQPPAHYLPRAANDRVNFSDNGTLVSGRVPNCGFEGMTLSPDGKRAVLALQSGLAQDGGKKSRFTRILVLDAESGKPLAEYAYPFDDAHEINARARLSPDEALSQKNLCITEIAAVNDHQFLVLERDNRGADGSPDPKPAIQKCVYIIDLNGATNLLARAGKALRDDASFVPVRKALLLNLASALPGIKTQELAEKWEALALTPPDANGHRKLLVAADNDFLTPRLHIEGHDIQFVRAQRPLCSQVLLFNVVLSPPTVVLPGQ